MHHKIVNLAPTGMIPTREMSAHVPLSIDEIVEDCRRCAERGAATFHLHARDANGVPTYDRQIYARLIGGIRETHPDAVICVSLSGRTFTEFSERSDPLRLEGDLKPDMASLTLSSLNFSQTASLNAPDMVRRLAEMMAEREIKPELEVFDLGMVNYAHYLADRGLLKPPYYFNVLLGNVATAQATPTHLAAIVSSLPANSLWCGAGIGGAQLTANAAGLLFGNGARVGLEDTLWYDRERAQPATNVGLVDRVVSLAQTLGHTIASAREVRQMLALAPHA
ncbi:MAG: 3-keto-5-aminohexanoate cleavage protein [Devosia sp.]|uniref:3-keto-5-aminohexanoate cleavage protein n=1 Tax=Devosia sp. TaxID=1871048 RepID=UPI001A47D546|nr:3-keto-5-aminohexanoate cleavage protein [Devosia sp.]MBL8599770.1 3-keto-5-aminohexanoate cleavage protein [Devosia sp.]